VSFELTDGTEVVSLNPEYDYRVKGKKMESQHRTRSGARFVYLWGDYNEVSFGVMFINSADKTVINSWWAGNDELVLRDNSGTVVVSGQLVNRTTPIDKIIKPYDDLFKGKIQLSTY